MDEGIGGALGHGGGARASPGGAPGLLQCHLGSRVGRGGGSGWARAVPQALLILLGREGTGGGHWDGDTGMGTPGWGHGAAPISSQLGSSAPCNPLHAHLWGPPDRRTPPSGGAPELGPGSAPCYSLHAGGWGTPGSPQALRGLILEGPCGGGALTASKAPVPGHSVGAKASSSPRVSSGPSSSYSVR